MEYQRDSACQRNEARAGGERLKRETWRRMAGSGRKASFAHCQNVISLKLFDKQFPLEISSTELTSITKDSFLSLSFSFFLSISFPRLLFLSPFIPFFSPSFLLHSFLFLLSSLSLVLPLKWPRALWEMDWGWIE